MNLSEATAILRRLYDQSVAVARLHEVFALAADAEKLAAQAVNARGELAQVREAIEAAKDQVDAATRKARTEHETEIVRLKGVMDTARSEHHRKLEAMRQMQRESEAESAAAKERHVELRRGLEAETGRVQRELDAKRAELERVKKEFGAVIERLKGLA